MHIEPYLGEEIGRGKSGFVVNRGAVNQGFTIYCTIYMEETYYISFKMNTLKISVRRQKQFKPGHI